MKGILLGAMLLAFAFVSNAQEIAKAGKSTQELSSTEVRRDIGITFTMEQLRGSNGFIKIIEESIRDREPDGSAIEAYVGLRHEPKTKNGKPYFEFEEMVLTDLWKDDWKNKSEIKKLKTHIKRNKEVYLAKVKRVVGSEAHVTESKAKLEAEFNKIQTGLKNRLKLLQKNKKALKYLTKKDRKLLESSDISYSLERSEKGGTEGGICGYDLYLNKWQTSIVFRTPGNTDFRPIHNHGRDDDYEPMYEYVERYNRYLAKKTGVTYEDFLEKGAEKSEMTLKEYMRMEKKDELGAFHNRKAKELGISVSEHNRMLKQIKYQYRADQKARMACLKSIRNKINGKSFNILLK